MVDSSNRPGGFRNKKTKVMKTASFDKLVYMGVKMVLDCTPGWNGGRGFGGNKSFKRTTGVGIKKCDH